MPRFTLAAAVALIPASASFGGAPAEAATAAPRILLEAQENLSLNDDPTRAAVVFSLRNGEADSTWDVFARDIKDEDLRGIESWQLQFFDSREKKVGYVQGRGEPPRTIDWFGLSEEGNLLPNGFYQARLLWKDASRTVHKTAPVSTSLLTLDEMRDFLGENVTLSYVDRGLVIRIVEGLLFPLGRSDIQPDSLPALAKIALFLKSHPRNRLVVEGFTDSRGTQAVNDLISSKRAQAVYEYLISAGVDPARASYEGRGSGAPIASNATAEGRAKNRRVEILVLKVGG